MFLSISCKTKCINCNIYFPAIDIVHNLRKLQSVKRVILIATFTKQSIRSILEFMHPQDDVLRHPLVPIRCCVVDTVPNGSHFEVVIVLERRFMKKLKPMVNEDWDSNIEILPEENDKMLNPMYNKGGELRDKLNYKRGLVGNEPEPPNKACRYDLPQNKRSN